MKPGERVGALLCIAGDTLELLGYGVYEGEEVPTSEAEGFAAFARMMDRPNPKIRLDDGNVVWGGECWWGPEASMKQHIEEAKEHGAIIKMVNIEEARASLRPS